MTSSRLRFITNPPENLDEAKRRIDQCIRNRSEVLGLEGLGLRQLPEEVSSLTWLNKLWLTNNLISEVPEFVGKLTELEWLGLEENPIQLLPSTLSQLTKLKYLIIAGGLPSAADPVIGSLANLNTLVLNGVELREFPDWILDLKNLDSLYLQDNHLTDLPASIGKLAQLMILNISRNDFRQLPSSLLNLKSLALLYIDPILGIPKEIIQDGKAKTIFDFYFGVKPQLQPLNEFKLILVGRGGVGKTTLVHRLKTDRFKELKRTPGINITKWPIQIDGDQVQAHIWDFGGQEIMHRTHRFFMTERALYLILTSGESNTEDYDAEYWLSLVRSFAGNVPVIVLLNKWDDYPFELNRQLLKEKYGQDLVFVETDSRTGKGISQLYESISQLAKELPDLKAAWPTEWRQIKEELPRKRRWLTFEDFREYCAKRGIDQPKDQEALADSLHHLGLMLSYRKEDALRDFGVLNPRWVTRGIYQILNSAQLRKAQGEFTPKTFGELLSNRIYPEAVHPYLLALMRKFQLCHPLDDKGKKYLIPELLTKEEPDGLEAEFPPHECLGFEYRYDTVLPEGLLPRFIVETYFVRVPKLVWRTGAVLERANCRALVRGDIQGRRVVIRVSGVGKGQRELLGIIREYFERIHRSFEKLLVTEMVPIQDYPEIAVPYETLLAYEAVADDEYKIVVNGLQMKISVAKHLDGVDLPGSRYAIRQVRTGQPRFIGTVSYPSLFISYAHKDERFRDELRGALTTYERTGRLDVWDDTCIVPGQKWEEEILEKLENADIVVLLLSNDFIRSDYCFTKEMQAARERDEVGECAIVPIVVRACRYDQLELGQLQAIQPNGKPIREHRHRDAAWLEVTKQLDKVIALLNQREPLQ